MSQQNKQPPLSDSTQAATGTTQRLTPPDNTAAEGPTVRLPKGRPFTLPQILLDGYRWYSGENEKSFMDLYEALIILADANIEIQIPLHEKAIEHVLHKDLAERACNNAGIFSGYNGYRVYQSSSIFQLPSGTKTIAIYDKNTSNEYYCSDLTEFRQPLPISAVRMIQFITKCEYPPSNLLILRYKRTNGPTKLLCAQFGAWLANIASWIS